MACSCLRCRLDEQELAFEEWKVRELSRVRKEKEEREAAIKVRHRCVPALKDGSVICLPRCFDVQCFRVADCTGYIHTSLLSLIQPRETLPFQEREDTLRRRNMTDDERRMEDMMLGKHLGKDKGTIKFMQKYYHKGAFYMVCRIPF